jgi:probable rRNA maturation factor
VSAAGRAVQVVVEGIAAPRWRARVSSFCSRVLRETGAREWDVAVLLCGDQRISALNGRYRGTSSATDVLSFPREEHACADPVAGDIAVSLETLRRNAVRLGLTEDEELKRLLVHGILHLAGMDHGRGKGGAMLALQEDLLRRLGAEHIVGEQKK